jgi:hypothetical protein
MGEEPKGMHGETTRAAEPLFFKGKSFKVERKASGEEAAIKGKEPRKSIREFVVLS